MGAGARRAPVQRVESHDRIEVETRSLSDTGESAADAAARIQAMNKGVLDHALASDDRERMWAFFCECGAPECRESVGLTVDAYLAVRYDGGRILALGHRAASD